MAVANSGSGVLVDSAGATLANFTSAAASNIKIQDNSIYTIASGAVGSNANGQILLAKASGSLATLDSAHSFICTNAVINGSLPTDSPVANMALSIKGAKLIMTSTAAVSELTAPMIGDSQTQITYKSGGSTWNSIHHGVNLNGSTLIFEGGGDGHLGRSPLATVKDVTMLWRATAPSDFVLAISQAWGSDNKPSSLDGYRFISVLGNNLVSIFTFNPSTGLLPGNIANNYFFVCKDWTYDVASVGGKPTALLRSYRRTSATSNSGSYWGAVAINPTHLHIDLKTTLSSAGVLNSTPTYLRTVNYNAVGTMAGDVADDIVAYRFNPTVIDPTGTNLSDCSVVVLNTNASCSASNAIGTLRARLAASGLTNSSGQITITEPSTKSYTSNASHRTDSIVIRNRVRTQAWHKWWESNTKLIIISDSRNGTGTTAPEAYASTDYQVIYRRAGSVFSSGALTMAAPQSPTVALSTDSNYNSAISTTGIAVSYESGITTVTPVAGTYTLDQVYKAIIDYHATPDRNEAETVLPVAQNNGVLNFGSALVLAVNSAHTFNAGTQVTSIVTTQTLQFNGAGQAAANFLYTNIVGESTIYELRDIKPGAAYIIATNSTRATLIYGANNESTAQTCTVTFPPGSAGTQIYVARKAVGDFFNSEVVTLEAGFMGTVFIDIPDDGAKETNQSVLNAYTELETNTKVYNYVTGIYMRTEEGIKLGEFFLREGKSLKWAAPYSVLVKKDAASLIIKAGNVFSIKANVLALDENYETHILVPPATLSVATNEVITTEAEDALGDSSLEIAGGDGVFELWKVATSTATADYATGTKIADVPNEKYRFIGVAGFDIVGIDILSNIRRRTSMVKGSYTQSFYVGEQILLAQAPQVIENGVKLNILEAKIDDIMGTDFAKDKHSLTKIWRAAKFAASVSSWFR